MAAQMDTSKPSLKVRSLGLWRVPGPFTIMITAVIQGEKKHKKVSCRSSSSETL